MQYFAILQLLADKVAREVVHKEPNASYLAQAGQGALIFVIHIHDHWTHINTHYQIKVFMTSLYCSNFTSIRLCYSFPTNTTVKLKLEFLDEFSIKNDTYYTGYLIEE